MATQVGVGYSQLIDSYLAGKDCADKSYSAIMSQSPDILLVFTTSRHNPHNFIEGVKEIYPTSKILMGGYSVGIITKEFLGYDGFQCGLMAIISDTIHFKSFIGQDVHLDEEELGIELSQEIVNFPTKGHYDLLFFVDTVDRSSGRLKMNRISHFCHGINEYLDGKPINFAGIGMTGDMMFRPSYQWYQDNIYQNSGMALQISGNTKMFSLLLHGCKPASAYHTVTASDGVVILEIDGMPALDFLNDKLFGTSHKLAFEDYGFFLTIAVNSGDKYGDFEPEKFANKMVVNVDRERKGIIMVEPDLIPGTEIVFMQRSLDFDYMSKSIKKKLESIEEEGYNPSFAFYFNCAGRAAHYLGSDIEDGSIIQRELKNTIPFLGLYSGVEIGKINNKAEALDWTGALHIIAEKKDFIA